MVMKNFNKINKNFPETVASIITGNNQWFPLLDDYKNLHELIVEKLVGDTPELFKDDIHTFTISSVIFLKDRIKFISYDFGPYTFSMADKFTFKDTTGIDYRQIKKSDYKIWYKNNSEIIKNLGLYSIVYKHFL